MWLAHLQVQFKKIILVKLETRVRKSDFLGLQKMFSRPVKVIFSLRVFAGINKPFCTCIGAASLQPDFHYKFNGSADFQNFCRT